MPKQFKTYTRFDGGLNTKTNSRSIQDNELAQANNVIVDEFGMVKSCGKVADNTSDYTAPSLTATQPGYGLFQATFDYASGGGNTSTIRTFLADADDGTDVVVHVLDATTWDTNDINLGNVTGANQGKVIYHIADGGVRICDTNILNTSTAIKHYGYIQRAGGWSGTSPGGSGYTAAWETSDVSLSKPTAGIVGTDIFGVDVNDGASDTDTLTSSVSGNFEDYGTPLGGSSFTLASSITDTDATVTVASTSTIKVGMKVTGTGITAGSYVTEITDSTHFEISQNAGGSGTTTPTLTFDGGKHFALSSNGDFDAIFDVSGDTALVTSIGSSDDATWSASGVTFAIYPPVGEGWNLDIALTNSAGTWTAGEYDFASTFIYDGIQESLPFEMVGSVTVAANDKLTCTVLATEFLGTVRYAGRITGGRLYSRLTRSKDDWSFLGEIDIANGTRATLESTYQGWTISHADAPSFMRSAFISEAQNIDTFQSLNGYSQDASVLSIGAAGEKYQTSIVANRRSFIANVRHTDSKGSLANKGDTIRYSEINRFDTFPEFNFIDIGINDGESFIKLESYADRILAFKEKTLYIINIGGGSDTQWFLESEHKNMGVDFHALTVKTDSGIAWVNKNGLFFYDGRQVKNLQTKILESEWSAFVNADTMIGYEPTHKHLVVVRDAAASGTTSGDAYVYSFITNSFTFVEDMVVNAVKTNIITDAYNKMTLGSALDELESYDGEPDSGATFDIILKDDDFGIPNVVKKIYGVTVEYASNATNSNGIKYFYTNDSGTKQAVANAGSLASTSNDLDINKATFGTPLLASSFQVQLDMDGDSLQKINNVGVEYRPIHKRIT